MYDIHCHLIYGVDDGSDSPDESLRMLRSAAEGGTKGIIATPHANISGSFENYWSRSLFNQLSELRQLAADNEIPVDIYAGQEIFCTADTISLLKSGKLITLNNSKYILIEFPFGEYSSTVFKRTSALLSEGLIPVIAHPERYYFIQEDEESLIRLHESGCILQMNKGSLDGVFGESAVYVSKFMMENWLVDCIASDAHSPYSRTPYLESLHETISDDYDIDYADLLLVNNPMNIICNKETEHF